MALVMRMFSLQVKKQATISSRRRNRYFSTCLRKG
jgi:hypothetical protein